ncbi:MAG: CheR family methyltransferase, partial [Thermodesulfobacteriota bacterium]
MTPKLTIQEFQLLRDLIEKQSGILLADEKAYLVENRLATLLATLSCRSFGELYFRAAGEGVHGRIRAAIIEAITTKETSWFRGEKVFQVLRDRILAGYWREMGQGHRSGVDVWSAASSTGQEPYSIAMTALDLHQTLGGERSCRERIHILATDISQASIEAAQAGRYEAAAVRRGVPEDFLERYFAQKDDHWLVKREVRQLVTFRRVNLREPFPTLGPFDVIFL